jgi:hypothetical protein
MSSIKGTNVLAPVVPFDTTDSHASHEARYGKGGYRSVADIAERDAIPQLRREAGMLVLTMSGGKFWKLAADLAAWSEISLAGPQGPQGIAGAVGPQGPAGVAGADGAQGPAASLNYASISDFPATGSDSALYLAEDTSRIYQWESPYYVEVGVSSGVANHASSHATGGIDAITPASIGAAAASHVHSADAITSGVLPDARLSANVVTNAAILARLSMPTTAVETFPRMTISQGLALSSGNVLYSFFTPLTTLTVSQVTILSGSTAAAGLTLARMGLVTYDEVTGTATLVAQTTSDTSLFAATRTAYTRSFSTDGGFPATFTLTAGTRYGVALLCIGTTVPTIQGNAGLAEMSALTPRLSAVRTSQTDLSTVTATNAQSQVLYARFS